VPNLPLYQRTRGSPHCVTRCTEHLAGPVRTREAEACSLRTDARCAIPYWPQKWRWPGAASFQSLVLWM